MKNSLTRRHALIRLAVIACLLPSFARAGDERPIDRDVPREKVAAQNLPTLWIAGDSTVRSNAPLRGWGQDLGTFFDPAKINVVNRAIGGRSSRTFFTEGRWKEILDAIKPGDFVIIQFGHNDVGPLDERGKFRGSVKGIGEESEKVTKPDGTVEEVRSYGWYLREMARGAREKKARVILCSPIPHKKFDGEGKFVRDWAEFRGWVEACAKAENAAFLDLAELIASGLRQARSADHRELTSPTRAPTPARPDRYSMRRPSLPDCAPFPPLRWTRYLNAEGKEIPAT